MHHLQRILPLAHMQSGQGAPGPADRIKCAPGEIIEQFGFGQNLARDARRLLGRPLGGIHQRQAAKRESDAAAGFSVVDIDQFERTAAEIADDAIGLMDRTQHAERREFGFPLAVEQRDSAADRAFREFEKLWAIRGVAHRRGRQRPDIPDAHRAAEHFEPLQRRQSLGDRLVRQKACCRNAFAEAAQHLFVEGRRRRPRQGFVGDEAHRIRTDVDDRHRLAGQAPSRFRTDINGLSINAGNFSVAVFDWEANAGSILSAICRGPTDWGWS